MNRSDNVGWFILVLLAALLNCADLAAEQLDEIGYPTFLSPHSSPIVKSGSLVFVVNTPADTVDVIDASSRAIVARINVGIDPVGIAVRPDGKEIWVSNHVSDSVSVIDSDPLSLTYLAVIATIQEFNPITRATRFDEPVGVAFASNDKAYIALSSENQVAIINVATRQVENRLAINSQDPRAIRVRGDRLYVIPFESNNQTQISGCEGNLDGDLCTFNGTEHVVTNNNVLSLGIDVDIVKNRQIPDRDLYVFDTSSDELLETVVGVGTLLYGLTVDSKGRVFVSQTDARNDVNGRAGTFGDGLEEMENRAFLNRVTVVDCISGPCAVPQFIDLEPLLPLNPDPGRALATPFALEISDDDATLVASAAGSNMLFTVDVASGQVLGRIEVGAVPRGIALESSQSGQPSRAWVLNAAANSVSLVDVSDPSSLRVTDTIVLEDPTHPAVKRGRIAFNNAGASTTGTFSCESCHPDGGTDQLLWVLNTPVCSLPGCTQIPPRITMPIRGLRDTAPYHWDGIPGDPYGGINTASINAPDQPNCSREVPESCTLGLVDGGLASTMCEAGSCPINEEGKAGALTAAERHDMAKFLLSVPYPPSQRRSYTNVLSSGAVDGFSLFHIEGDLQGNPEPNVCGNCHRMPFWVSTNTPGTGMEAPTWRGAYDRWLILPQGRLNLIDFSFYRPLAQQGTPERSVWRLSWANRPRFDPVWNMVLEGSTGFSGAFARQVTLNEAFADSSLSPDLLDALELAAKEDGVVLQGEGIFLEQGVARKVVLQFDRLRQGDSYVDRANPDATYTRSELVSLASEGNFLGTFTARLGARVDLDSPQPALWTRGPMHVQRSSQAFPTLSGDDTTMIISGRHVRDGANLYIDGRRVAGSVICQSGELTECKDEVLEVQLASLPQPEGLHFLQIQNPVGLFSNDFIFHTNNAKSDNCPGIPNPEQKDTDGDGVGDRCDDDAFPFAINPGISGTWFDPSHNGEGWVVELLDENNALVYWFTYTPPAVGQGQAQAWIGGLGKVIGSSIVVAANDSWISSGSPFGPDFNPADVEVRPWGKFVLSFSACDSGLMYYQSVDPDYGHGSMNLQRLTSIDRLECGQGSGQDTQEPLEDAFAVSAAISGAWYDKSHDGEGWLLEVLPGGQALVAWFGFDSDGEQAWFLNTGTVEGDTINFDLLMPSGTDFGPTFDSGELSFLPWGSATFKFDDCSSGSMTYDSPLPGYGSGSLVLSRLTQLSGLGCATQN